MDARTRERERSARKEPTPANVGVVDVDRRRRGGNYLDRDALEASLCRDSLYDFVQRFWAEVIPEEPVWNWHIKVLCDELQDVAERVFRGEPKKHDLVINVPPGTSKSTICSVMFPAWVWTRMPTARSLCASYAYNLAMDLSRKSRDIVQSDKWIRLFGDISLREDQNTKGYFLNTAGGSRYAVGTGGSCTGFHGHFLIIDDPVDPQKAISEIELKGANTWVRETFSTRKVNKAVSVTICIMQRLHQSDPSAEMLKRAEEGGAKVRHICLPGEVTGREDVRPRILFRHYVDGLLDTARLSRLVLEQLRPVLGEYGYAGQILQRPVPLGGGQFKTDRIVLDVPPPLKHFKGLCRFWDKAGTLGGGAYSVGALLGRDAADRYWLLDVVRGQWDSDRREQIILATAKLDGYGVMVGVEQEPGSGGKESAQNTVRMLAGYRVRTERPTGDKAMRADPLSVQVNAGNVSMQAGLWNAPLIEEMKFFPHSTYKDQVDACSGAFTLLSRPIIVLGGLSGKTAKKRRSKRS